MILQISLPAQSDLDDVWLSIAQDNLIAADDVIDYIGETFLALLETPMIGRVRPELWPDAMCFTVFKSSWRSRYLIFYRIAGDGIEIARVLEGHRDISPEFFEH